MTTKNLFDLISPIEKNKILNDFNKTYANYPRNKTILDLFAVSVAKFPSNTAIVCGDKKLNYQQLDELSDKIASSLPERNHAQQVVAIYLTRRIEIIAAMLACWKGGFAYMFIDEKYPLARVQYMLENAQSCAFISESKLINDIQFDHDYIDIEHIYKIRTNTSKRQKLSPSELAILIYTSGSTGNPKGVMLSQQNLTNHCCWYAKKRCLNENDHIAEHASFSFDAAIIGTFPILITGGTMHILTDQVKMSLDLLDKYIHQNNIKGLFLTTQLGEQYLANYDNDTLEFIELGGEKLKSWYKRQHQIINAYGPTESTVYVSDYTVTKNHQNIPIGSPLDNVQIYIVNQQLQLCPIGETGELCIAGENLSLGYYNNDEETQKKFIANPYANVGDCRISKDRLYRTGDLARWRADGNIEIIGRIDFQVKIRGYRIELGEIEAQLININGIQAACVLACDDENANKFLCAYYTAQQPLQEHDLQSKLKKSLPEYMIPDIYLKLDQLPITTNGKIDRKALPKPELQSNKHYIAPRDKFEKIAANAIRLVLNLKKVGAKDHFFKLGGSSITAISLVAILNKQGFNITSVDIFEYPSVAAIAKLIKNSHKKTSIPIAPKQQHYPVTSSQKGMYITDKVEVQGLAYNIPICLSIHGDLDKQRLGNAIDTLIQRHESLRTHFAYINNEVVQTISATIDIPKQLIKVPKRELQGKIKSFIQEFDLSKPPLMRVMLFEVAREQYILLFDFHHIIFDGSSSNLFIKELFVLYNGSAIEKLQISYKDYAYWYANHYLKSEEFKQAKTYWQTHLKNYTPLEFPYDHKRTHGISNAGKTLEQELDINLTKKIATYCKQKNITAYMLTAATFSLLLSHYARQNDITVGTATSGRLHPETNSIIGMFVHTLPLRLNVASTCSINEYIQHAKATILDLQRHQGYNLEQISEDLQLDFRNNPLFDISFNYVELQKTIQCNNLEVNVQHLHSNHAKFNLTFVIHSSNDKLNINIEYRADLFEHHTIDQLLKRYIHLLESLINAPSDTALKQLSLITNDEKDLILNQFNDSYTEYPRDKTIIDLFSENVKKIPNANAVVCGNKKLNYQQLEKLSNRIANALPQSKGNQHVIAIYLTRRIEILAIKLACWKAGFAYVCIDEKYPLTRVQYMLDNSNARTLISEKTLIEKIQYQNDYIDVDQCSNNSIHYQAVKSVPAELATLIYTSGSTGKPKGVMLTHNNLMNLCCWYVKKYQLSSKDSIAAYASFSFDAALIDIYPMLITAGTVHLLRDNERMSLEKLHNYLNKNSITGLFLTTQLAEQYVSHYDNSNLKYIMAGGEKLKKWLPRHYSLINGYGPTESSACVADFNVQQDADNIPVGRPIDNVQIYITDQHMQLCPIGIPGELCIAGESLATGYYQNIAVSQEKFIKNPFANEGDPRIKKNVLYKTGDLARWRADGNIEIIGRIDFQVKVRGYRIELGEIEAQLINISDINDACVIALDDNNGNKFLCAYYTASKAFTEQKLHATLKNSLPEYMVPEIYIKLDKLPLTANGKVDRKALPKPELQSQSQYVAPRTMTEKKLADLWAEALNVKKVGINDHFFRLGGNSIKAIAFIAEAQKHSLNIKINQVYTHPTIKSLLQNIELEEFNFNAQLENIKQKALQKPSVALQKALQKEKKKAKRQSQKLIQKIAYTELNEEVQQQCVLVTGGTGHLGAHIIEELLRNGKQVIALVRAEDNDKAQQRVAQQLQHYFANSCEVYLTQLSVYAGDLEKDMLGLSTKCYKAISKVIDSIIHAAAKVDHYGDYQQSYLANVVTTDKLIELALEGNNTHFHFISTRSVCEGININGRLSRVFSESDVPDIQDCVDNIYLKTKLTAEHHVIEARKQGLNVTIYRVGNLIFNSKTLQHQANLNSNGFYKTLRGFLNLACIYDGFQIEMSCVDKTAEAICKISNKKALQNNIYHLYNPQQVNLSKLLSKKNSPLNIESVTFEQYIDMIKRLHNNNELSEFIKDQLLHFGWLNEKVGTATHCVIVQDYTNAVLKKLGFNWGKVQLKQLSDMIEQAFQQRLIYLREHNLFCALSPKFIEQMAYQMKIVVHKQRISLQALNQQKINIVIDGFANLNFASPGGWEGTVKIIAPDDLLGADSILHNKPSQHGSIEPVLDEITVLEIDLNKLEQNCLQHAQFICNLLRFVTNERDIYQKMLLMMR